MPILNYTTQIDVYKSIGEIQKILGDHGVFKQSIIYDSGKTPSGLTFTILFQGEEIDFSLPCKIDWVLWRLKNSRIPSKLQTKDQAYRVAWRIIKDWVEAQMALIESELADLEEVFFPYMVSNNGAQTMFESFRDRNFLLPSWEHHEKH